MRDKLSADSKPCLKRNVYVCEFGILNQLIGDSLSNWGQKQCPQFGLIDFCLHRG